MKNIIDLLPANGKIKLGSFISFRGHNHVVSKLENDIINDDIPLSKVKLLKYFVTNSKGVVGELDYVCYNMIRKGDVVNPTNRVILNKMEIGDEVIIHKLDTKLCELDLDELKGKIIAINGRTATISIYGCNESIDIKRHRFKLIGKNYRTICKI